MFLVENLWSVFGEVYTPDLWFIFLRDFQKLSSLSWRVERLSNNVRRVKMSVFT